MTHHSGLPSDYLKGMWTRNPESFTRVADRLKDEYAANPPGTVFSYSNLGVTLLGDAIGKVAGRDFASHVRGEVLLPPGMGETVRVVTINGENMLSYSGYLLRKRGESGAKNSSDGTKSNGDIGKGGDRTVYENSSCID